MINAQPELYDIVPVDKDDIIIREEAPDEYHTVEDVVLRAFWNKHHLGCNEHIFAYPQAIYAAKSI